MALAERADFALQIGPRVAFFFFCLLLILARKDKLSLVVQKFR